MLKYVSWTIRNYLQAMLYSEILKFKQFFSETECDKFFVDKSTDKRFSNEKKIWKIFPGSTACGSIEI